jgi:hypothetical protein
MGIWDLAHGTWHMATWHMGTWAWANQKPGNAHHNGIGEISCGNVFNCCFRAKILLQRVVQLLAGHIPSASSSQALELIN